MAEEAEGVLDLEDEMEERPDEPENPDTEDQPEGGDDDILIGFGDEEITAEPESPTIKHMREVLKDKDRRIKELQAKVPKVEVGPKPTLESCDYDEDRYDTAILAWNERKAQASAEQAPVVTQSEDAREEYNTELAQYAQQRTKLARPDFDVAETVVTDRLDEVQQSILVVASKSKAALVYALYRSPERLDALASIKNPIKLAVAVSDLERSLKVQSRRKGVEPEPRMTGGTPNAETADKKEARLEKEADRTGDRTALIRYRAEKKGAK